MGHVAYPEEALNPTPILTQALHTLLHHRWDNTDPTPFPKTSLQITRLFSDGGAVNVIPEQAEARLNFRFPPTTPHETLIETTEALLAPLGGRVHCHWNLSATPYYSPAGSLVQRCEQVLQKNGIDKIEKSTGGGTSDGRFLEPLCDQIVEMGAKYGKAHQCNESIGIDELERLGHLYHGIVESILR
jgi:succinyl-diaminopimelate desuccinylase